jgi:hypothetical protein
MASLPSPESRDVQEMIRHLKWSHAEKQIARKAFELALDREFQSVIQRAKEAVSSKPRSNPHQNSAGGLARTMSAWSVAAIRSST